MKLAVLETCEGKTLDTGVRGCFGGTAGGVSEEMDALLAPPRKLDRILTGDEDKKERGFSTLHVMVVPRSILV